MKTSLKLLMSLPLVALVVLVGVAASTTNPPIVLPVTSSTNAVTLPSIRTDWVWTRNLSVTNNGVFGASTVTYTNIQSLYGNIQAVSGKFLGDASSLSHVKFNCDLTNAAPADATNVLGWVDITFTNGTTFKMPLYQ